MTLSTRYIIDTGPKINTFGLELWKILIRKDENHIVVFDYEMKGFLGILLCDICDVFLAHRTIQKAP